MNAPESTATMPETNELQAARERLQSIECLQEKELVELERKKKLAAKLQEEINAAQQSQTKLIGDAHDAKQAARLAEARIVPPAINYKTASHAAKRILGALELDESTLNNTKAQEQNDAIWNAIDQARNVLLTTETEGDDCELLTLAVEFCISIADGWELAAVSPGFNGQNAGYSLTKSRRFSKAASELTAILDGTELPPEMPQIGSLVREGLTTQQIAMSLQLVGGDNKPDIDLLAKLIDSRCEIQPTWLCIRSRGTTSIDLAWERRQADVDRRRRLPFRRPGASAHGMPRPGRAAR